MFGVYRTFLALMVVALHLGGVPMVGVYAVFGFYSLSGYLMTLIMQTSYGYTAAGLYRYALNRFLRIYPAYWVSIIISALLIWCLGRDFTTAYHPSMYYPENVFVLVKNLSLFSLKGSFSRLTPPAWALTIEIFFYILIGLGISKSKKTTLAWFLCSVFYHFATIVLGLDWSARYYSASAASLPFATGALLFHYGPEISKYKSQLNQNFYQYLPYAIIACILVNWFLGYILSQSGGFFFYSNYVLCAAMVVVLSDMKQLPYISQETDKWLGEFSYPIYLLHYQVGLVVIVLFTAAGFNVNRPSLSLMVLSLPMIFALSWAIILILEKPIESIRTKVKSQNYGQKSVRLP
ncbi:MAG: acyltransferase [Nodosilinea sp.]